MSLSGKELIMSDFNKIIFLSPICTHNIWGGDRLRNEFHYLAPDKHTGECWGISAVPGGEGIVKNGRFRGMRLSELWQQHQELFGNTGGDRFPLLTKIIDAREKLSIQVHPDDIYAREHENGSLGKTECWYVLDCPENAKLIIGHNAASRQELCEMIEAGRWTELLREIPVKRGDFIQIEPGTVHAIEEGFLMLETQQSSDITYRVYDYDRLLDGSPRKLHKEKSIDVIQVPARAAEDSIKSTNGLPLNQLNLLYSGQYYSIFKLRVEGMAEFEQKYPFLLLSVCEGKGCVNGIPVEKGEHFILPCGFGRVELEGDFMMIASTPGDVLQMPHSRFLPLK